MLALKHFVGIALTESPEMSRCIGEAGGVSYVAVSEPGVSDSCISAV